MSKEYLIDREFLKIEFNNQTLPVADFEGCSFKQCNFTGTDLSGYNFTDCLFSNCNLSGAKIIDTTFNDVIFRDNKMLGLHFEAANSFLFTVRFEHCTLDLSSFYKRNMKKTVFEHCSLHEVDFIETNLSEAIFNDCDLNLAKFENSNLEKADFRKAFNYTIDPEINKVKNAKFSLPQAVRLLQKYQLIID